MGKALTMSRDVFVCVPLKGDQEMTRTFKNLRAANRWVEKLSWTESRIDGIPTCTWNCTMYEWDMSREQSEFVPVNCLNPCFGWELSDSPSDDEILEEQQRQVLLWKAGKSKLFPRRVVVGHFQ